MNINNNDSTYIMYMVIPNNFPVLNIEYQNERVD